MMRAPPTFVSNDKPIAPSGTTPHADEDIATAGVAALEVPQETSHPTAALAKSAPIAPAHEGSKHWPLLATKTFAGNATNVGHTPPRLP
jgi:hypothetical protein